VETKTREIGVAKTKGRRKKARVKGTKERKKENEK